MGARRRTDAPTAQARRRARRGTAAHRGARGAPARGAAFCGELVEHMLDGFSLLTPDGVHLDVNPALCEMTGFAATS